MSLRRSSRILNKPTPSSQLTLSDAETFELGQDNEDAYSEDETPKRKRQKKTVASEISAESSSKPKRKRGKLRMLPEMPLDILFDV
jgi:hypothetical protein